MESGKDQLANQLGQAENEVINGKSQAFVAESDLSQNYTVLKATDELIKRAIPELQSIYEQGMGLKADIEQAQKEAQMNSDDGSRRIEELLEEAKISGDQEQINQILAMTGENQESIAEAGKRLELLQEELLELNTSLNQQWADQLAALNVSLSSIDDIPQVITQLSQKQVEIQTAMAALQTAQEQVTDGKTTLDDAYVTLNRMEIDGILEMSEASAQLAVGEARLEQGQEKLEESKQSALESADLNQILSVETLGQILTAQNFSMPAGYVNENKKQYLVRVGDEVSSVEELENLVLVDVGCRLEDYCSDQTRTFWVGEKPTERFKKTLEAVQEAQHKAIRAIHPGVLACDVYKAARGHFESLGVAEAFTHGVGLETHEGPSLNGRNKTPLEPGMIVTVEPGLYFPEWGGIRWEHMVLVTEDGCRVL